MTHLGYEVSSKGLLPGQHKVQVVKAFVRPTNVKELQGFHGLTSYFRRFIPNFSKIAATLTRLFRKDSPWYWGTEQEVAFTQLEEILCNAQMLACPDPTQPFYLHTDASIEGLGCCLMQRDKTRPELFRPVGYTSRVLLDREKCYTVSEIEAMAVVFALHYYKWMIQGCDIVVVTDHSALCHLMNQKEPKSNRLFRWRLEISDFKCLDGLVKFVYKPGAHHTVPDYFSRNPLQIDQVPDELTNLDQEKWVAAQVLLEILDEDVELIGLYSSPVEPQANCQSAQGQTTVFRMPHLQAIADTVKKWQSKDR